MRYIIYGAGAVGGVIGARLFQAGHDVVLIARGDHLRAIQQEGLLFQAPGGSVRLPLAAVASVAEALPRQDDVVFLAMKTQDTLPALRELAAVNPGATVVCAQNGVENERLALRSFERVYGMLVFLPATFLEPAVVQANSEFRPGVLDIGRYPDGAGAAAERIAGHLETAGFSSRAVSDVMRWKHGKLLGNLANAVQAVCGPGPDGAQLSALLRAEGVACLRAAGIEFPDEDEMRARTSPHVRVGAIAGERRQAGSSWQSLVRGAGSIEADYLNGEVVLLGRLHGIPTPANSLIRDIANRLAREGLPPGSVSAAEVMARLAADD
jgi:2-dehydropantoate 2-reductase